MGKLLWFFQQPGRIDAGPVFAHIYDGVLFVYAYGVNENMPEMLFYQRWDETPEKAQTWLKRYVNETLKSETHVVKRRLKPGDDGPEFKLFGG